MKIIIFAMLTCLLGILPAFAQTEQPATSTAYFGVAWSADSRHLSFTKMLMTNSRPPVMRADVYTMKPDGTDVKKVTGDEQNEFGASWSKDGKLIFFGASVQGSREGNIFSVKADGTGLTQITKDIGRSGSPEVSRDGKKIVFNAEQVARKPQIYVMNLDGSGVKALTSDNTIAFFNPVWSPDGKKIVYYAEKGDNKDQIWTMNADGSNPTLLTNNVGHNFYPSWSADGKQIIFCSNRDGENEVIYSMNADGSNIKRLLKTNSTYARFSPDGKKIAFLAGKFPKTDIFVANADGSNEINLTAQK